jgi:hypothetical protein
MALMDEIADIVYNAVNPIGGDNWDITLKVKAAATKDAYGVTTQSTTSYTGRGFLEDYSDAQRLAGGFPSTDRKIILFDSSFTAGIDPAAGDIITAESTDYEIITIKRDPAEATWECRAR